ncbi:MAG: nucleotidyltransferase domain-containing protein [Planctomycetota bacterium]
MDISRIFNSKTRAELFRLYFTNPEAGYYLRELERTLGIPVSMVRTELVRLEKNGIFTSSRKANLVYFYLNKSYPLFSELKSIVSKTVGVRGMLGKILGRLAGVEAAFIYGSFAKNTENAKSDIDLFVIGKLDEYELAGQIRKAGKTLKREINYSLFSRADFDNGKKNKDSFISDLISNPKIFLIGDDHDL